ncbi:GAF and ANTAR domain-containing protein [Cellulomonas terrae]|uniref:RNA-binding protein n=1 Tax=Cellulomonas terrae TaxID=311234 RepID=A0A511JHI7_9CELL|nr:GAF and ANTAR domain-containing protein [Cellulomonas terrae]GEL97472.1 RNA-binding protein [Cellulomonas terrae]
MTDPLDRAALIAELQDLLLETPALQEFVEGVAVAAAHHFGPATSATVSMQRHGRPNTVAASDTRTAECDQVEYDADSGPCLDALRGGTVVTSDDLAVEHRWSAWLVAARDRGFASVLAIPRTVRPGVEIALNLYAREPGAWDGPVLAVAHLYADEIARAMHLYLRGTDQAELNADLRAAILSRSVIDQAIGVIMAQNRCTEDRAIEMLRAASQHRNVKLRDVATILVQSVAGVPPRDVDTFHDRGS